MDRMICIAGPTATGKTRLAVALAQALDGEVISCDSMQLYRGMDIGTAKVTAREAQGIVHHMVDILEPSESYSVGRFVHEAVPIADSLLARGKTAILAGGTGLYMDALVAGRSFAAPATGHRQRLERLADEEGIEAVLALLRQFDPESARLHPSNRRRIIRAAEVYYETGQTITEHNRRTQLEPPRYQPVWIGLDFQQRQDLYDRINRRVDRMMEQGLLEEIQALLDRGVPPTATSMQAIGYKEPLAALRGEMSMDEAVEKIKQLSRNYAKRQLTWLRRNPEIHWIRMPQEPDFDEIFAQARAIIPFFDKA